MADEVSLEMLLHLLQRMQADVREVKDSMRECVRRLGRIEQNQAAGHVASVDESLRLDRLALLVIGAIHER